VQIRRDGLFRDAVVSVWLDGRVEPAQPMPPRMWPAQLFCGLMFGKHLGKHLPVYLHSVTRPLARVLGGPTMRHRLIELNSRYGNPQTLRLIYILLVLLAMAAAGAAPIGSQVGSS
jgi:hypothetical protein